MASFLRAGTVYWVQHALWSQLDIFLTWTLLHRFKAGTVYWVLLGFTLIVLDPTNDSWGLLLSHYRWCCSMLGFLAPRVARLTNTPLHPSDCLCLCRHFTLCWSPEKSLSGKPRVGYSLRRQLRGRPVKLFFSLKKGGNNTRLPDFHSLIVFFLHSTAFPFCCLFVGPPVISLSLSSLSRALTAPRSAWGRAPRRSVGEGGCFLVLKTNLELSKRSEARCQRPLLPCQRWGVGKSIIVEVPTPTSASASLLFRSTTADRKSVV